MPNNRNLAQIARKIAWAKYAADFRREFGDVFGSPSDTVNALGQALEAFLTSDEMAPFSSKYDAYIRGEAKLTALEARGLKLFKDPDQSRCRATRKFQPTGMLGTSISASANVGMRLLRRTTKVGA